MQKIHFNNRHGLTRAVVEEYKTKTRRIATFDEIKDPHTGWLTEKSEAGKLVLCDGCLIVAKSQYRMNEILAVAQSYKDAGIDPHFLMFQPIKGSTYFAEMETEAMFTGGWTNKMFVRADLMSHQIQITDIKAERLQDISDEDCIKEGIIIDTHRGVLDDNIYMFEVEGKHYCQWHFPNPREAFAALIERPGIGHKGDWSKNPWVFAYTFKLIK